MKRGTKILHAYPPGNGKTGRPYGAAVAFIRARTRRLRRFTWRDFVPPLSPETASRMTLQMTNRGEFTIVSAPQTGRRGRPTILIPR